jgi:undecaprenyl-diphosphatase
MVSRQLGILAMVHAFFVVCLPRIYVGYHYPTDIVAGMFVGIAVAFVCKWVLLRKGITRPMLRLMEERPAFFYSLAFAWTFEVAELFTSVLNFQSLVRHSLGGFLQLHL